MPKTSARSSAASAVTPRFPRISSLTRVFVQPIFSAKAAWLFRQLGNIQLPIAIDEIARAVGITDIQDLHSSGFEGALITDDVKSEGIILVNRNSPQERRRFTIGHEIGHFLNFWDKPPKGGFQCSKQDMLSTGGAGNAHAKMEAEANEFSAEMLMPEELFRSDLNKKASPGLEHIVAWADKYETSRLATAWRFVELYDSPCAAILSKDGKFQFARRNDRFRYIDLRKDQQIPKKSLTSRFSGAGDGCSNTDDTESSLWISKRLSHGTEMYEQVLVQGKGYRITLLTIDELETEEDDEEEYASDRSERRPYFR